MDAGDLDLRRRTYAYMVETGCAPRADELGGADDVRAGWRRLHDAHAIVLNSETEEIRMLNPLSAVPTAYRVHAQDRWWYANCAWDAFGICAALHADGRIETSCADCGEPVAVDVLDGKPDDDSLLFHVLVPAHRWWDDIVFTRPAAGRDDHGGEAL